MDGSGEIRVRAGVANISATMREPRVRWLGHIERIARKLWYYSSNGNMEDCNEWKIGRPKQRWSRVIRKDMKEKGVERRSTSPKNENSMPRVPTKVSLTE